MLNRSITKKYLQIKCNCNDTKNDLKNILSYKYIVKIIMSNSKLNINIMVNKEGKC